MDLRSLIEQYARILGPAATAERIEALVAATLDATKGEHQGVPTTNNGERVLITAYGRDRHGVLAAVTAIVSGMDCNILDVSQKILQGYFTMIMLADIQHMRGSLAELQQRLDDKSRELGVRILAQHEDLFNAMHRP
ncbi:MAG: ACT domain-containing protein [Bacteroidota bacterium]